MDKEKQKLSDFFRKEYQKLIHYVRKLLKDSGERNADDIIQDVMVSIYEKTDPLISIENIGAYIYRSLYHKIVDQYRKKKDKPLHFEDVMNPQSGETLSDILADTHYDTHSTAEKNEIKERIFKAVDHLKPDQKAVWIAVEIEGYTFDELSLLWQEPIGTLLARKYRASRVLRKKLEVFKKNWV